MWNKEDVNLFDLSYLKKSCFVMKGAGKLFIYFSIKNKTSYIEIWNFNENKTDKENWEELELNLRERMKKENVTTYAPAFFIPEQYKPYVKKYNLKKKS